MLLKIRGKNHSPETLHKDVVLCHFKYLTALRPAIFSLCVGGLINVFCFEVSE